MTAFDWMVVAVAGLSLLIGLWRGVVSEVLALAAWVAAFFAASKFSAQAAGFLGGVVKDKTLSQVAGFVLVFIGVLLLFALARLLAKRLLEAVGLGPVDRLLGGVFGLARAAAVLVCMVALGGMTALPQQTWWREASLAPPLETAVLVLKPQLPQVMAKKIHFR